MGDSISFSDRKKYSDISYGTRRLGELGDMRVRCRDAVAELGWPNAWGHSMGSFW